MILISLEKLFWKCPTILPSLFVTTFISAHKDAVSQCDMKIIPWRHLPMHWLPKFSVLFCKYVLAKLLLLSVQLYPILPWIGSSQDLPRLTLFLTTLPVTSMLPHPKGNLMSSSYLIFQQNLKEVELFHFFKCMHAFFFFIWCSPLSSPWLLLLILLARFSSKVNLFLNVNIST